MVTELVVGILVIIISSAIIYFFKTRQLYAVCSKIYPISYLNSSSQLFEVRAFNRGVHVEEEIRIVLNREYSYELVAATEDISFHHPNLWISRLDPDQECSALIMAKDCSLKKEDVIRISSSTKGGTIKDEPTSVPPNYGAIIVVFIIIAILGSLPILGFEGYERWKQHQGSQYAELLSSDSNYEFSNVTSFFYSDLAESYKEGEFPFHIKEVRRKGEYLVVDALAINETAAPMDFYVSPEWPYDKDDPEPWKSTTYKDVEVAPKDKKIISISIYWPSDLVKNDKNIDLKLDLESGAEMITNIIITIPVEAQNEKDS